MTLPESRKYYRPCGEAFQKYGGDLNVQAFGDRLCEIDDALYAADVVIDRLSAALSAVKLAIYTDEGTIEYSLNPKGFLSWENHKGYKVFNITVGTP